MIEEIILNVSAASILLPFVLSLFRLKQLRGGLRPVFWYLLVSLVAAMAMQILWWMKRNNLFIFHLHTIAEIAIISLFYVHTYNHKTFTRIALSVAGIFIVFAVLYALFVQSFNRYNSLPRALEAALVIVYSILLFFKMMKEKQITSLTRSPEFWINAAFLLFFSGSFFLFISGNIILSEYSAETSRIIWSSFGVLTIITYVLISIGLWRSKTT